LDGQDQASQCHPGTLQAPGHEALCQAGERISSSPKNVRQRRPVHKLRLQMLGRWHENIDEWVTTTIAKWGFEDFELVIDGYCEGYNLKQLDRYRNIRLERLVLSNY